MKLQQGEREFAIIGGGEPLAYTVNDSVEFMALLSGGIYKDQPKAIVRELCNNASDSHAVAGQTRPVEIHMPTLASPMFKVRDFGTGLSKEDMEKLYRTYGRSNKNQMDEANGEVVTGCMGIGSKAPFSYADAFTSISYYNGVAHVYCNAKDEKGKPQLIPQGSFPTEQSNGLEVSFLVREKDIPAFQRAVRSALRPFKNRPTIVNDHITINEYEYTYESKGWGLRGSNADESLAVMAQVEYPIDSNFFADDGYDPDDWYSKKNKYQILLNQGLVIEFGPGEVQFTMSRETLDYTPYTVRKIRERLDEILNELQAMIENQIQSCKSLWEARMLYQQLKYGELSFLGEILRCIPSEWNGEDITKASIHFGKIPGLTVYEFYKEYRRVNPKRRDNCEIVNVERNERIGFLRSDIERGSFALCLRQIRDVNSYDRIYLVCGDDTAVKTFKDKVGLVDDLVKTSSFPPSPRGKYAKNNTFAYELTGTKEYKSYRERRPEWWTKAEVDLDEGGVYVEINNYEVVGIGHPCYLVQKINALNNAGIDTPKIYGIKTAKLKQFKEDENWQSFSEWSHEQLDATVEKEKLQDCIDKVYTANSYSNLGSVVTLAKNVSAPDGSQAKEFFDAVLEVSDNYQTANKKVEVLRNAASKFGYNFKPSLLTDLNSMEKDFKTNYPMMTFVLGSSFSRNYNLVTEYINLIES